MAGVGRKKSDSFRTTVSLSPELHEWVSGIADSMGLSIAMCINVLLTEAKRNRENSTRMVDLFNNMAKQYMAVMQASLQEAAEKLQMEMELPFKGSK